MKIWKLSSDVQNYDAVKPVDGYNHSFVLTFNGASKADTWTPLQVKRVYPKQNLPLGDCPNFFMTVFSQRAVDALYPLIQNDAELLPLDFDEQKLYGINVTSVLNVLDYEKSDYIKFDNSDRIMVIEKYVFGKSDELLRHDIFKLIDEPVCHPFVTDRFKRIVEKAHLEGFAFELVWDSEEVHSEEKTSNEKANEIDYEYAAGNDIHGCDNERGSDRYYSIVKKPETSTVYQFEEQGRKAFDIPKDLNGRALAERVYEITEELLSDRRKLDRFENKHKLYNELGCLFGAAICCEYGWHWMEAGEPSPNSALDDGFNTMTQLHIVVPPNDMYSFAPVKLIGRILERRNTGLGGENDNTIMLLFNMLPDIDEQIRNTKVKFLPIT